MRVSFTQSRLRLAFASWCLAAAFLLAGSLAHGAEPMPDRQRATLIVEALKKLETTDLRQNPALESTLLRVLPEVRGTPDFVELVRKFSVPGQEAGLIETAVARPEQSAGVEAARMALAGKGQNLILATVRGTNIDGAVRLLLALGNTHQPMPWLHPLLADHKLALPVRRQLVVAMAQSEEGTRALLARVKADELPEDLRLTASLALSQCRWPDLRAEALRHVPPPVGRNAQPLPPLPELLARVGDPVLGKEIFFRADAACASCHQVRGAGRDVGPDLSEIGGKLGKDALYEAVINPNAGISFGFEAWTLELASGEEPYGLIISETAEEVALKETTGIVTRYPKGQITGRRQHKLSLMPTGLHQTMTADELVSLVEYLASLKKP